MNSTTHRIAPRRPRTRLRELAPVCLLLMSASCVPNGTAERPASAGAALALAARAAPASAVPAPLVPGQPAAVAAIAPAEAVAANAALPVSDAPNPAARAVTFRAASAIDRMRALDCLTDAIYYEARSESEDGQRAVAQVVLNRVRHPAYPNSVCGVVYQGPMRAGGGCQFTFTCDGSLAVGPRQPGWSRARAIAVSALAGRVYAPVGHATHYHTHQVFPHWAPKLVKLGAIGSHIFYRFGGPGGAPAGFAARYAGLEPSPAPALALPALAAPQLPIATAALLQADQPGSVKLRFAAAAPALAAQPETAPAGSLPESTIREEYRNTGQPYPTAAAGQ